MMCDKKTFWLAAITTFFILVLVWIFVTSLASASPFLVADPVPQSEVTSYVITTGLDSLYKPTPATKVHTMVPISMTGLNTYRLKFDVGPIFVTGPNYLTVKAVNDLFGRESAVVPFFYNLTSPSSITGLKLEK